MGVNVIEKISIVKKINKFRGSFLGKTIPRKLISLQ